MQLWRLWSCRVQPALGHCSRGITSWCNLRSAWQLTDALLQSALDFVYPRTCHWCTRLLPDDAANSCRFCDKCTLLLAPVGGDRCQRCSAPVGPNLNTSHGCLHCSRHSMKYSRIISLGPYLDELRRASLKCKHPRQAALTNALTELMCRRNGEILREWNADMVIPVPHYWMDRLRADHAAATIGESLGRFLKVPVERHILRKVKRTRKQQKLPAHARQENLRGAFEVARSAHRRVAGRRVVLADDILTTGITADRCSRVLLHAGATRVDVAVLARAIGS